MTMGFYLFPALLFASVAVGHHLVPLDTRQSNATAASSVPSRVENGIQTECKTCPYSLCTNVVAYEYSQDMNLTCWTTGDMIVDTNTWYKTTDNCYVTEWDIIEGNYTDVLASCGEVAETYTSGPSKTEYNTECNIIPEFVGEIEDHTKMYQPEVDLTLTCYTINGDEVLGNSKWYKTLSNCYVPEAQIEFVDADLDDCGPIPFLEAKMRQPDPEPSTPTPAEDFARRAASGADVGRQEEHKRWLYLTQIGDDQASCLAEPDSTSESQHTYSFGEYIVVQCATYSENLVDDNQIYLLTEDFCWVNDTLTDPTLIDDETRAERYPNCNLFVDTVV
ncbi:hypothetical protein M406DRAFT_351611 [Cryphonectria parasitica EP155]|uniref:Uncharacterized protein n=1 Tax=Cryphonectria parasitica (strain ATCC 38755 / EP155) TaxID=660469 RepID=A0A9P5CNI7_CRYP1|nr:uncharacterized protein M406DRAFT_351611 [Cryphonectria parasitica EP155]KAF3764166.1 hypothetical protein M406DRAFT_351611 [Cryphonectria parasitica EP155]